LRIEFWKECGGIIYNYKKKQKIYYIISGGWLKEKKIRNSGTTNKETKRQ